MHDSTTPPDDEISLYDMYLFIKDGWQTVVRTGVLGGVIGLATAFIVPVKYEAYAALAPAKILGGDVESITVLAEKLRLPRYYSPNTLEVCAVADLAGAPEVLIKNLKPAIGKNSFFVGLNYRASSPEQATACLNAVLKDINVQQNEIAKPQIFQARERIRSDEQKLKLAEAFIQEASAKALSFRFNDPQFSASSLLTFTLQTKQNEAVELNNSIRNTKMALEEPQTRPARYAAPIYAPPEKVSPSRLLILILSIISGGFLGLLWLLAKRVRKNIRALEARAQNASGVSMTL